MAQTLEEFLISVKYNIDQPSQQKFFDSLKRIAGSLSGIAGEITGLGVAVLALSEKMAAAGEKLYWTSQRVGDSVTQIQGMAFAMSNLGMTADAATQGIERFGAWTRNMGPSALMYMRSLGVTARDTVGQMHQLAEYFRQHGGTYAASQGTDAERLQYAITLRQAGLMNISEQMMLALSSGKIEQGEQQAGLMRRLVWGKDAERGPQQFAQQSLAVMNQFRQMGLFFDTLSQKFALGLFNAILPDLTKLNDLLVTMIPDINRFMDHLISYAPTVLHFLEGVVKGFDVLIKLGAVAMETFDRLPVALQHAAEAFLLLPKAISLIGSPLFWILGGLTALLLLLDDYQHWQKDQETHSAVKHSKFDWSKPDAMFKGIEQHIEPFLKVTREIDAWLKGLTGVDHLFTTIAATLGLILIRMTLAAGFNALLGMGKGLGTGISNWLGGFGGLLSKVGSLLRVAGLPVAAGVGGALIIKDAESDENTTLAKRLFNDDSATSLVRALIAKKMSGWAGTSEEDWIKRNFPQWLEKKAEEKKVEEKTETPATPAPAAAPAAPAAPTTTETPAPAAVPAAPVAPAPAATPAVPEAPKPLVNFGVTDWINKPRPTINLGIGDWLSHIYDRFKYGPEDLQRDSAKQRGQQQAPYHEMQRMPDGSYKLASASDTDWMVPQGFGGPIKDDDDDRFFDMLRLNTDAMIEKLRDILDTLTAMALKEGVDPATLHGGGGGGGGGDDDGGGGDLLPPGASLDEQEARLRMIERRESGGQNILNRQGPGGTPASTASGYYQMIDSTWKLAAKLAGIDASHYNRAIDAPYELQHKAALALINAQGERPWVSSAPRHTLSHLPPGADGSGGVGGGTTPWGNKPPTRQEIHNETHINVTAPNPASAAHQVAEAQPRINERHIRYAKGVLLA